MLSLLLVFVLDLLPVPCYLEFVSLLHIYMPELLYAWTELSLTCVAVICELVAWDSLAFWYPLLCRAWMLVSCCTCCLCDHVEFECCLSLSVTVLALLCIIMHTCMCCFLLETYVCWALLCCVACFVDISLFGFVCDIMYSHLFCLLSCVACCYSGLISCCC